jgi:hypothetical protein
LGAKRLRPKLDQSYRLIQSCKHVELYFNSPIRLYGLHRDNIIYNWIYTSIHPYVFMAYRGTTLCISGAILPFTHMPLWLTQGQHYVKVELYFHSSIPLYGLQRNNIVYKWSYTSIHPYAFMVYTGTTLCISGAILPFTHTPLWLTQGQHYVKVELCFHSPIRLYGLQTDSITFTLFC